MVGCPYERVHSTCDGAMDEPSQGKIMRKYASGGRSLWIDVLVLLIND